MKPTIDQLKVVAFISAIAAAIIFIVITAIVVISIIVSVGV